MLNTKNMNLNLVRTFVIVGQSKDLKEAASKLEIDISNVSRNIKSLETIMKTKLINRKVKNYIELTDDGKLLFEGYEKAYNILFITEKAYLQNKTLNTGKISIGISGDIESDLLNDKIIEFKKNYPNVTIKIINLPTKDLFEKLSQYYIDIVIDEKFENLKKSDSICAINVFNEEYCIAYSKEIKNEKLTDISQLNDQPLILPISSKKERKLFEDLLDKKNIQKNLSIETSNYISSKYYAESGFGFALLPKRFIKDSNLEYMDLNIIKSIDLSYIEGNLSPSAKEFINNFAGLDK